MDWGSNESHNHSFIPHWHQAILFLLYYHMIHRSNHQRCVFESKFIHMWIDEMISNPYSIIFTCIHGSFLLLKMRPHDDGPHQQVLINFLRVLWVSFENRLNCWVNGSDGKTSKFKWSWQIWSHGHGMWRMSRGGRENGHWQPPGEVTPLKLTFNPGCWLE